MGFFRKNEIPELAGLLAGMVTGGKADRIRIEVERRTSGVYLTAERYDGYSCTATKTFTLVGDNDFVSPENAYKYISAKEGGDGDE